MLNWFNLGKRKRSRLGKFLDEEGISQIELQKKSKLSQGTISRLCNDDEYQPKYSTIVKIKKALKALGVDPPSDDHFGM